MDRETLSAKLMTATTDASSCCGGNSTCCWPGSVLTKAGGSPAWTPAWPRSERLRKELVELQEGVDRTPAGADAFLRRRLETRFQKLVLRVEAEFNEEYYRWRIVIQRNTYELS